ncbi:MAG: hypothetical protein H6706_31140 [Myxococcales bacterium]|nr:hypothetical protein [Myxococcales bacterium]
MTARWSLALCLLLALPAPAAPTPAEEAERLFQVGNRAARRQRWAEALAAWQASEALVPAWQPAFNQATVLVFTGEPLAGWAACQRALQRDPPAERRAKVVAECDAIEAKLLATHAAIRLEVTPADAEVTLEGAPWPAPRRVLVPRAESRLEVRREGHAVQRLTWRHPIGQRSQQTIQLAPLPAAPPTAAPPSAAPPSAAPPSAPPPAPRSVPWVAPATAPPLAGGPDPLWKWIAFGSGAAAGGAAAFLLADAAELRTPRVFAVERTDAEDAYTARRDTGLALAITGGVGLVVGAVLWALEDAP